MKILINILVFALLSFLAWNYFGLLFVISIAYLFLILKQLKSKKWYVTIPIIFAISFLLNVVVTFWLLKISWWEGILIFLCNGIVLTIPILIFHFIRTKYECFLFSFIWISFEVLHTQWDISWPWITFGNVMGNQYYLVQWYSFFGVYSGSLWLIILGFLLFQISNEQKKMNLVKFSLMLFLPILLSISIYYLKPLNIINNENISTYIPEKEDFKTNTQKISDLTEEIKSKKNIKFIVSPEIFFRNSHPQNITSGPESYFFNKILDNNRNLKFIFGVEFYNSKNQIFNCVAVLSKNEILSRTKKKYVPIREYTPKKLRFIYGETYYTKNTLDDSKKIESTTKISTILCYESVFSSFIADITYNTDLICILTSEYFMNDSDFAKKQYLNIIRLRAIECNRNILKCSSGGISSTINEKGDVTKYIESNFQSNLIYRINNNTIYQELIHLL